MEEHRAEVRAMNLGVADRACLVLVGLIMERRNAGSLPSCINGVTPQAQKVHVVNLQQTRVGRSMRCVAVKATLARLDRCVLKHKRAHRVRVAFCADLELARSGTQLVAGLGPMRVVAIAALDQP